MSQHCDPERSCSSIAPVGGTWSGWPSPRPPLGMPSQHHHVVAPSTCQPTEIVPSPLQPPRPTVMKCPPLLYTKAASLYVTLPNGVCSTNASRRAVSSWTASLYTDSARSGGASDPVHATVYQLCRLQELLPQLPQCPTPRTSASLNSSNRSAAMGSPKQGVSSNVNTLLIHLC